MGFLSLIAFFLSSFYIFGAKEIDEPIPPLPDMAEVAKKDETEKSILEEGKSFEPSGFFSDTSQNKGYSRFLNALELQGYFRFRLPYFRNAHLKTYIPSFGGTSLMSPSASYLKPRPKDDGDDDDKKYDEENPSVNNWSSNMRLRLEPTINVSEIVRINSTLDFLDNIVLGSTPNQNSFMSMSQTNPMEGAIKLKRLWAEANFPIGDIRFGRIPFHFGLGILYNSGDNLHDDYGDQVDGIFLSTRIFDVYVTPGYSIAQSGPVGRGFGLGAHDNPKRFLPNEDGQKYPLDSADITHVFSLSILKRDSDFIISQKKELKKTIFQYGIFGSYRNQHLDSQYEGLEVKNLNEVANKIVKRNAHMGMSSLWMALGYKDFHIESEFAGVFGKYTIGDSAEDLLAKRSDGTLEEKKDIWLLQGGLALQSKYGFLNDHLQVGLDGGIASGENSFGFGVRDKKTKHQSGKYSTNFSFHPSYTVDLLLYREVIGAVSGSYYFKPHIGYFFSENLGVRGDVITSFADFAKSTPGNSNLLGVEVDLSTFFRTDSGFYLNLAYGVLFPFKGLNNEKTTNISSKDFNTFGEAKTAQTLQLNLGISF